MTHEIPVLIAGGGPHRSRPLLLSYKTYYNETRTHLSLSKDAPLPRTVQPTGPIFSVPILGGVPTENLIRSGAGSRIGLSIA
jgi:hypothetical protein